MKFVVDIHASFSDKIVDLSDYLVGIAVNYDYKDKIMPMWAFTFKMPEVIKQELQSRDFTIPFNIWSIKNISYEIDDPYASNEDIIYDELIYEDEIIEYNKTFSNFKIITDNEDEDHSLNIATFSLSGLSKKIMEINSSVLNGNYRNTTSIKALNASMEDINNKINIVTSEDTLNTVYEQIIIPPMNIIPSIRHLISYYPIYNSNTGIFFNDSNNLHIFTDKINSLRSNIIVEIVDISQEMGYDPDEFILNKIGDNSYRYKTSNTPVFETMKKISDNLLGIDKVIYSYDDIFNLNINTIDDSSNIYEKKRIYWDSSGDISTPNIVEDIYKRNRITSIPFSNVDPRIFTQYSYVIFEGSESVDYIKGMYSVKGKTEIFASSDKNKRIFNNEIVLMLENVVE